MTHSKILFIGGGSIGHIAPSVAVWREIEKINPDAECFFVCVNRPDDKEFLTVQNVPFTAIEAPRISLSFPWKFLQATKQCSAILEEQQPDVIFSKGGYVSVPLCYAAHKKGIPIVLHESDTVSGRANVLVSKWAKTICTGFPIPKSQSPDPNPQHTGNPIRPEVTQGSREEALKITGLRGERPVLLVMGGSQGAQALNEYIYGHLEELTKICDIIHITGRGKSSNTLKLEARSYFSTEFSTELLQHFYALANVCLCRSGAGSIAELAANGIPTILVPLRGVGHDHQQSNAEVAEKSGGCISVQQIDMDETLLEIIRTILTDKDTLQNMSTNIRTLHTPDAAKKIAEIILN